MYHLGFRDALNSLNPVHGHVWHVRYHVCALKAFHRQHGHEGCRVMLGYVPRAGALALDARI